MCVQVRQAIHSYLNEQENVLLVFQRMLSTFSEVGDPNEPGSTNDERVYRATRSSEEVINTLQREMDLDDMIQQYFSLILHDHNIRLIPR